MADNENADLWAQIAMSLPRNGTRIPRELITELLQDLHQQTAAYDSILVSLEDFISRHSFQLGMPPENGHGLDIGIPGSASRIPVTTLASMLPETVYDETKETKSDNTLEYIKVQRNLLEYLGKHAADTLTAQLACQWTRDISETTTTTANDALRLCYYMRSQGFDTYADVKQGSMSLYIINQHTAMRGPRTDMLYWKQDVITNEIQFAASHGRSTVRRERRNAVVPGCPPAPGTPGHRYGDNGDDPADYEQEGEPANATVGTVHNTMEDSPTVLLAAAEATLANLLASDEANPT